MSTRLLFEIWLYGVPAFGSALRSLFRSVEALFKSERQMRQIVTIRSRLVCFRNLELVIPVSFGICHSLCAWAHQKKKPI
jgi:hypothetical protein